MMTRLQAFALMSLATLVCVVAPAAVGQDQQAERIKFLGTAQAFANGVANEQVTVLVFGAQWCGACKKLDRTVFADQDVRKAATKMSWAKIDIDKDPQFAAMFGVRAVPTIIFLNTKGEPLHQQAGLASVQKMTALLNEYADQANTPGTARGKEEQLLELIKQANALPKGADIPSPTVLQILELIAVPDPIGAEETRHRLIAMGPAAWNALIDAMEHRKLAVRAAAYDLLKETTGHVIAYDPFLEAKARTEQVQHWRNWLKVSRPASSQPDTKQAETDSPDTDKEEKTTPKAPR